MTGNCVFCKIAGGAIKADIVFSNDDIMAFRDLNPQAEVHFLVIPRKHIETLNDIEEEDRPLIGDIFSVIKKLAREHGVAASGYRVVANCNRAAGQEVFHVHFHLLGGRDFRWPPG